MVSDYVFITNVQGSHLLLFFDIVFVNESRPGYLMPMLPLFFLL